jgi:alkylation response protein AidB-like acyl-CoA dehydrogenase
MWRHEKRGDPVARDRLVRLWIDAECLRLTNVRAALQRDSGAPGPEGSIGKVLQASVNQRVYEFCVDLLGAAGSLFDYRRGPELTEDFFRESEDSSFEPDATAEEIAVFGLLRSRASSIEGGTSEILRNILAERVLGLPGDVRTDRDVPWRDVPRS